MVVILLPVFGHLSELPVQRWDESRLAVNAYEMYIEHNWLVPTFLWEPDMWNTKPPLLIWLQVLCFRTIGVGELAARLPSALAALGTFLFIYWFFAYKFKNRLLGILAPAILVVSEGYIRIHGTRTGDYDSLLTMFTTIAVLYFYLYLKDRRGKYLILTAVSISLGCLTKGVSVLIFMPAMFCFALLTENISKILTSKAFYIGLAVFILLVPGYYLLREMYNSGYIAAVAENELGGRFSTALEGHIEPWYFYFVWLYKTGILLVLLSVVGVVASFGKGDIDTRQISRYLGASALSYLFIISVAQTKLDWYSIPLYPLMAILAAIVIYDTARILYTRMKFGKHLKCIVLLVPFAIVYAISYEHILNSTWSTDEYLKSPQNALPYYIKEDIGNKKGIQLTGILYGEIQPDLIWYEEINEHISFKMIRHLEPGDKVTAYNAESIDIIENEYEYELLDMFNDVRVYGIKGKKQVEMPEQSDL